MEKRGKRILIVEDEPELQEILVKKLREEGFETLVAKDGEEGLALAISQQPALILLDIVLPKMDGVAMLKKLREDNWGKMASVIFLSNLSDTESLENALEKGASNYLVKSNWDLNDIVKKINEELDCA